MLSTVGPALRGCTWPLPVTERRAVALGDLLHLVVVSQHEEGLLEFAHLFHFGHHVLVDAIHDLLRDRDLPVYQAQYFTVTFWELAEGQLAVKGMLNKVLLNQTF